MLTAGPMASSMGAVPGSTAPIAMSRVDKLLAVNRQSQNPILHKRLRPDLRDDPAAISTIVTDCLRRIRRRQPEKKHRHMHTQTVASSQTRGPLGALPADVLGHHGTDIAIEVQAERPSAVSRHGGRLTSSGASGPA